MTTISATKVTPLGDRVLIKPKARDEVTKSGIVLPDTAKEKPQEGIVVAVGPGQRNDKGIILPLDVKEGQTVLYAKYAGTEITIERDDHLILKESDILAIVE